MFTWCVLCNICCFAVYHSLTLVCKSTLLTPIYPPAAALKNSTLQVPDENDRITAQRVHSASIVRVALILRSVNAVFQRCCLHSPPAQGDAPEWASFFGRAKAFDCCPLLLSAGNVLLEGVVSLTADGAPGPGGFAIGRVAATILTCCQCSEENCISIALAGGVKLLGELLRFVRSFEVGHLRWTSVCGA